MKYFWKSPWRKYTGITYYDFKRNEKFHSYFGGKSSFKPIAIDKTEVYDAKNHIEEIEKLIAFNNLIPCRGVPEKLRFPFFSL